MLQVPIISYRKGCVQVIILGEFINMSQKPNLMGKYNVINLERSRNYIFKLKTD